MSGAENHEFEFFCSLFEQNISVGLPLDGSFDVSCSIDVVGDDVFRKFLLEIDIVMSSSLFMHITYYSVMTDTNECD